MPRFVLLRHECPPSKPSHWDLMFEWEGVLRTWDLRELPRLWAHVFSETSSRIKVPAIALPDHRLAYLDYEGPVTGNRGHVRRCDRGDCEFLAVAEDAIVVRLMGEKLNGVVQLSLHDSQWWLTASRNEAEPG